MNFFLLLRCKSVRTSGVSTDYTVRFNDGDIHEWKPAEEVRLTKQKRTTQNLRSKPPTITLSPTYEALPMDQDSPIAMNSSKGTNLQDMGGFYPQLVEAETAHDINSKAPLRKVTLHLSEDLDLDVGEAVSLRRFVCMSLYEKVVNPYFHAPITRLQCQLHLHQEEVIQIIAASISSRFLQVNNRGIYKSSYK